MNQFHTLVKAKLTRCIVGHDLKQNRRCYEEGCSTVWVPRVQKHYGLAIR